LKSIATSFGACAIGSPREGGNPISGSKKALLLLKMREVYCLTVDGIYDSRYLAISPHYCNPLSFVDQMGGQLDAII
jgi:hypothetical protein